MPYYESAEGELITRKRVMHELKKHQADDKSTILIFDKDVFAQSERFI